MLGDEQSADLVSVVIPAYNAADFIERTLVSVIDQIHRNLEIIVVDDGSTDKTADIVQGMMDHDKRLQLIRVTNGGVARARNIGLDRASAEYVAFLDADDLWRPDKIRRQLASLQRGGEDYAGCYTLHQSIDLQDRVAFNGPALVADGYIYARHLAFHFVGNGSSLLVRRSAARAIGGYDPSYADSGIGGCEDLDFELRLAARYKLCGIPLYLVGYRRYDGNMSSNRLRMSRSMTETINRRLALSPHLPIRAKRYALGSMLNYTVWVMLRDRRPLRALRAFARLAIVDYRKSVDIAFILTVRVLERLRIVKKDKVSGEFGSKFQDTPYRPTPITRKSWLFSRLGELELVDDELWLNIGKPS